MSLQSQGGSVIRGQQIKITSGAPTGWVVEVDAFVNGLPLEMLKTVAKKCEARIAREEASSSKPRKPALFRLKSAITVCEEKESDRLEKMKEYWIKICTLWATKDYQGVLDECLDDAQIIWCPEREKDCPLFFGVRAKDQFLAWFKEMEKYEWELRPKAFRAPPGKNSLYVDMDDDTMGINATTGYKRSLPGFTGKWIFNSTFDKIQAIENMGNPDDIIDLVNSGKAPEKPAEEKPTEETAQS